MEAAAHEAFVVLRILEMLHAIRMKVVLSGAWESTTDDNAATGKIIGGFVSDIFNLVYWRHICIEEVRDDRR